MLDLLLPPPKRTRSRRLRKKLRIGEFQTLGFEYDLIWFEAPSADVQERFIDQLLDEVIEPRSLLLGGGITCGFISARRGSATDEDRAVFEAWLRQWTDICNAQVGALQDAWYDNPTRA
jgi:uncharacterized protein